MKQTLSTLRQAFCHNRKSIMALSLLASLFILLPFKQGLTNTPTMIMAILGAGLCFKQPRRCWHELNQSGFLLLFACFFVPGLLSCFDAPSGLRSVLSWLRFPLMFLVVLRLLNPSTEFNQRFNSAKGLKIMLALMIFIWLMDALIQWLIGFNLLGYPRDTGYPYYVSRITGMFYPRFRFGVVLATLSPLFFCALRWKTPRQCWISTGLLVLMVFVVILTGTRSAFVVLGLSLLLWLLTSLHLHVLRWNGLKYLGVAFISIALATAYSSDSWERLKGFKQLIQVFQQEDVVKTEDYSVWHRFDIWETAWKVAKEHPWNGVGLRRFRNYYSLEDRNMLNSLNPDAYHVHSFALETASETGFIGLAGLLVLWGAVGAYLWNIKKQCREPERIYGWLIAAFIALFPLNSHMALYSTFFTHIVWCLLSIGLALRFYALSLPSTKTPPEREL